MTNTETVSTERLAFLKLWAEQSDDEITLKASEVRELLASRTQSPAEWQVEVQAAMSLMRRLGVTKLTWGDLAGMTSILAPDRSKEETGVRRLLDDNVIETIHGVYLMKVREYDADFRRDTPEDFWQKKYGTNLHSTGLGERWALKEALSQALSALETPPLHKEGEAEPVAAMDGEIAMLFAGLRRNATPDNALRLDRLESLYAAPVPVPVTITPGMVERAIKAVGHNPFLPENMRAALTAALSVKPGEQG